jgi:hypothetical protein
VYIDPFDIFKATCFHALALILDTRITNRARTIVKNLDVHNLIGACDIKCISLVFTAPYAYVSGVGDFAIAWIVQD